MSVVLTIAGINRTGFLEAGSISMQSRLNGRDRAGFTVITNAAWRPSIGQEVWITDAGTRVFGGTIDAMAEELVTTNGSTLAIDVDCVSYDSLMDRRIIAEAYESQTLGFIVNDIITKYFASEGLNTANVSTGPTIAKVFFNYQNGAEAFNLLSEVSGYNWWIDANKNLYFQDRGTIVAPFSLTSTSGNFRSVIVESTRTDYRNRQYVRAGVGLTATITETHKGDAIGSPLVGKRAFLLSYPAGTEPTISVGGVAIPVGEIGIREVELNMKWYWQLGSAVVNQAPEVLGVAQAPVADGVTVQISYRGQYPILVSAQDDVAIAQRIAVEGGTGVYDDIVEDSDISSETSATERAYGLLRRYARIQRRATVTTNATGLRAGQLVTLNITQHGLTGQWLVESVDTMDFNGQSVHYRVVLLDGEALGGWQQFFGAIIRSARKLEYKDNEVILLVRSVNDRTAYVDSQSYTTAAPTAPLVDTALVGFSELTS